MRTDRGRSGPLRAPALMVCVCVLATGLPAVQTGDSASTNAAPAASEPSDSMPIGNASATADQTSSDVNTLRVVVSTHQPADSSTVNWDVIDTTVVLLSLGALLLFAVIIPLSTMRIGFH